MNTSLSRTATPDSAPANPKSAVTVAFLVLFTDMLVYGLAVPVLPRLAVDAGVRAGAIGVLFACYAAGFLAGTPLVGRWVDRAGPRNPLLLGVAGLAAASVLFALSEHFWMLVLARLLQGTSAALSWVAALALVAGTTPFAERGRAMGIAISGMTTGLLLGPPLGGLLADHLGLPAPFIIAAALACLDALVYLMLVRSVPPVTDDPAGPLAVLRVPGSRAVVVVALLAAGTIATIEPVLPLRLREDLGVGSSATGLLFAITVVVGVVLSPVTGNLIGRIRVNLLVAVGAVLAGLALLVIGVATEVWHIAVAMAVLGVAYGPLLQTPATTLMGVQGQRAEPPALGAAYALYNFAFGGGLLLGPLIGSLPTQAFGFTTAMTASAAVIVITGLLSAVRLPRIPQATSG
ncbi:MFS transporter [Streptomyces sp. HC44]|uniref:MFS transporter n=1 Tax=Streptomyces scabichelini TaxID=2711217 RepID=A0A6G4UZ52_9ACTN|nr:MFS transporter [Streptomyces scabichelini]NGO07016.1 MFS transporter [Streptomyces scabichelini]